MIRQRWLDIAAQEGQPAADALRRLTVCQGGFTREAAAAILQLDTDSDELDHTLAMLRGWQFVVWNPTPGHYVIDPLVREAVGIDEDAIPAHREYYIRRDDLPNMQAAFDYALAQADFAAAYLIYSAALPHLDWIQQLAHAAREDADPALWNAIQNSLGVAYQNAPTGDRRENLRRAIAAYRDALPHDSTGQVHHNLGTAHADLARIEDRAENLWRAIDAYESALTMRTAGSRARGYAATQHLLGDAYRSLAGVENRGENLERAIHAYEEAARHYADSPLELAAIQHSLGNAYLDQAGIENRAANLRRAIESYETALELRTPARAPLAYAATKNNLGMAYRALASEDQPGIHLRWAIKLFKDALSCYSPQEHALDYAATQNNIGSAYRALAEIEEPAANLDRALHAFEQAVTYNLPHMAPLEYATTQANLGLVWRDLGDPARAASAWREAILYFQQMGVLDKARLMQEWIAEVEES